MSRDLPLPAALKKPMNSTKSFTSFLRDTLGSGDFLTQFKVMESHFNTVKKVCGEKYSCAMTKAKGEYRQRVAGWNSELLKPTHRMFSVNLSQLCKAAFFCFEPQINDNNDNKKTNKTKKTQIQTPPNAPKQPQKKTQTNLYRRYKNSTVLCVLIVQFSCTQKGLW